ncbi:MAG: DUF4418 family protein [Eubacteriales bacterium]
MKNRLLFGIFFIVLGALIAFGPQTIFPVCAVQAAQQSAAQSSAQPSMQMSSQSASASDEDSKTESAMPMVMKCAYTAQAELPIGIVIAALGALLIVFKSARVRIGLSIALVLGGVFALLVPTALIGVCAGEQMPCRALTLPALVILSVVVIASAALNAGYLLKSNKKGQVKP